MKILTMLAFALTLVACGSDESSEGGKTAPAAAEERAPTVGKEIADEFNSAMNRARRVEEQALQQKQKVDAALEAAEGDP